MNDIPEDKQIAKGELLKPSPSMEDLKAVGTILSGLVTPFAKAQETAAVEETKRVQIDADVSKKFHFGLFVLAMSGFLLAGIALFRDNSNLTQQIVIAVFSFIGGYGFGKNAD